MGSQGFREKRDIPKIAEPLTGEDQTVLRSFDECPNCQIQYFGKESFCSKCGNPVIKREILISSGAFENSNQVHKVYGNSISRRSRVKSIKSSNLVIAVIGLFLVLGVVATLNYGANESVQSKKTEVGSPISESLAVDQFSQKLGFEINQKEIFSRLVFPNIAESVVFYSAQGKNFNLLIYPTAEALRLDSANFKTDFNNFFIGQEWESCENIVAVFSTNLRNAVNSTVGHWCE